MQVDVLFANALITDLFRLRLFHGWAAVADGRFVAVEEGDPSDGWSAREVRDLQGRTLAPTLIDAHMHIESSLITPRRFAEAVLPFGTGAVLADPHEIANVAGVEGVRWMIAASHGLPLRVYIAIPSCVPATSPQIEWTAHTFDADAIRTLFDEPDVIALGEVMDYEGLLGQNDRLPALVQAARQAGLRLEGHIPTLSGARLSRYLAHGISSDHTLTFPDKIREQVSKGVTVMLQAKSVTPENMAAVAALPDRSGILLVTDDIEPTLLQAGHLSQIVTQAIEAGLAPLEAHASASLRAARYLNLRDLGAIAPGHRADCMVMDDLATFPPREVFIDGQPVAAAGQMLAHDWPELPPLPEFPPVPGDLRREDFRLAPADVAGDTVRANVVVLDNEYNTLTRLAQEPMSLRDGYAALAEDDGLDLVAVIARDRSAQTVGLIKHAKLLRGAFATSLAHDSHNLLVIGREVDAMLAAARAVHEMGGGVAVAQGDEVLATLPLPLFGLLSDAPVPEVARALEQVEAAMRRLGVTHQRPFLTFSIMALSVSPYYKFTDKGIVDTEQRQLLAPWEALENHD
ncbi:MAG: adenine deaminase [Chloroflexi bacterium]|nr:adenine deaminase [Chloroflexota bacterium]